MILMPLKLKYRNPHRLLHRPFDPKPDGTLTYAYSKFTSRTSNSGKAQKAMQGTGHRKRAYGPW